ncbi:hypothetical protein [Chryseobacterium camelliae]|uniref:hypothetical protein n=1 Tax=Chryseobacterium camelliae TaxID=1265445 RepID=UPI00286076D3|nr:hypothetical protein [Chryseobacterium camelliae]MDR6515457.1 hypothetical protein [Chryseobacterium camelliae]
MAGNCKHLMILLLYLSSFSCQNKTTKAQLGNKLISENLNVLLDDLKYFSTSDEHLSVAVYQYIGTSKSDQEIVIRKFEHKFGLTDEKIVKDPIKLEKLPESINHYSTFLDTDHSFHKKDNVIKVSFVNLMISNNNQYAAIEVIKSFGHGAKLELYYFKQVDGKWVFDSKEVLALG